MRTQDLAAARAWLDELAALASGLDEDATGEAVPEPAQAAELRADLARG